MENFIENLKLAIAPVRQRLINHPVYERIRSIEHLRIFMEHHVYAVWDFMSLLKSLQQELTCVTVPWVPAGTATTRYLVNEIVLGEESDVDEHGVRISHFELYVRAMQQVGASTDAIGRVVASVSEGIDIRTALQVPGVPPASADFCRNTFDVVADRKVHIQAAVFTFGREDLIPGMFMSFVSELNRQTNNTLSTMKYYLERHIEVDGDHHSHLGYQMVSELCGSDQGKWEEATREVQKALQSRINLWDAIVASIDANDTEISSR